MEQFTLKDIAIPIIKAIDQFNFLLKSHHRRVAVMSYFIGKEIGLNGNNLANLVVAAAMHDIGALNVEERDRLIQEDVDDPDAHCIMAYRILKDCELFSEIGMILKHHHVFYQKVPYLQDEIRIQSHIIHLADRIDIYLNPKIKPIEQVDDITEKIRRRTGRVFHPEIFEAYKNVSKNEAFWDGIDTITMEDILKKVDFNWNISLDQEKLTKFSLVISKIVDYRSHFTATHSYTVGNIAYSLGQMLKHSEDDCIKLKIAGYLHDIGKIGINPGVLEKPSLLTKEEYEIVKQHSTYTGEILKELSAYDWFKDIVKWATHHHEKLDGSGYPSQLKGDELDEGMIIVAYADIISALKEDRPQRKAFKTEDLIKELKVAESGKLNPKVFKKIKKNIKDLTQLVFKSQMEAKTIYVEPLENLLKAA